MSWVLELHAGGRGAEGYRRREIEVDLKRRSLRHDVSDLALRGVLCGNVQCGVWFIGNQ